MWKPTSIVQHAMLSDLLAAYLGWLRAGSPPSYSTAVTLRPSLPASAGVVTCQHDMKSSVESDVVAFCMRGTCMTQMTGQHLAWCQGQAS